MKASMASTACTVHPNSLVSASLAQWEALSSTSVASVLASIVEGREKRRRDFASPPDLHETW